MTDYLHPDIAASKAYVEETIAAHNRLVRGIQAVCKHERVLEARGVDGHMRICMRCAYEEHAHWFPTTRVRVIGANGGADDRAGDAVEADDRVRQARHDPGVLRRTGGRDDP